MRKLIEKIREKKGFTLAELLIVVAIIAVLVAIAIPVFTSQLEKSRDAVSIANLRSAYASAATAYLTGTGDTGVTVDTSAKTVTVTGIALKGSQTGFSGLQADLPFKHTLSDSSAEGGTPGDYTAVFTFEVSGAKNNCELTSFSKP